MNGSGTGDDEGSSSSTWQPTRPDAPPRHLPVRFTGSGSEYFRIWIVNLLLTLLTLGAYYPWAKVRRLRYFHGNTLVGEHPLGFHADPRKLMRGYLLVTLLLVLYSAAGHFSPLAGLMKKMFAMFANDHHGDGRIALWLDAPPGDHEILVAAEPERFFVPPYQGPFGWIGVRVDLDPDWDEVRELVVDAYRTSAQKSLLAALDSAEPPKEAKKAPSPKTRRKPVR